MGKNFPLIKNLKTHPEFWNQTLELIEKAFEYKEEFHFQDDFITLMNEDNASHLYILTDEDRVIAHLGVKVRDINIHEHKVGIAMMGGIAVHESYQGKGLFSYLMREVKKLHQHEVAAFILWSDQVSLYERFGFNLCGEQFALSKNIKETQPTTFSLLTNPNEEQKETIKRLYHSFMSQNFLSLNRTQKDWDYFFESQSIEVWVDNQNQVESYFVKNKGQDLQGVIHEFATNSEVIPFLEEISQWGTIWTAHHYFAEAEVQYQFLLAAGEKIGHLVSLITNGALHITSFDDQENEVHFNFNNESFTISCSEFFKGVFGPGHFSELEDIRNIFIAGWDSI